MPSERKPGAQPSERKPGAHTLTGTPKPCKHCGAPKTFYGNRWRCVPCWKIQYAAWVAKNLEYVRATARERTARNRNKHPGYYTQLKHTRRHATLGRVCVSCGESDSTKVWSDCRGHCGACRTVGSRNGWCPGPTGGAGPCGRGLYKRDPACKKCGAPNPTYVTPKPEHPNTEPRRARRQAAAKKAFLETVLKKLTKIERLVDDAVDAEDLDRAWAYFAKKFMKRERYANDPAYREKFKAGVRAAKAKRKSKNLQEAREWVAKTGFMDKWNQNQTGEDTQS